MKEVILKVFSNSSNQNLSFGLRLSTDSRIETSECSKLEIVLDNNVIRNISALKTYQNNQKLSNPFIKEWIIKNNLNDYIPNEPMEIKFLLVIDGNKHTFKFLSF